MRGALVLLLFSVPALFAQEITFATISSEVVAQRFARLQPDNPKRAETLKAMFTEAGCPPEHWTEPAVKRSKLPNLICTRPGDSSRTIVVTAHYDKTDAGQGAIDNWSGASLLPSLYQCLGDQPRKLTFVFLLTTDEEKGLVGAQDFVKKLKDEERKNIAAAVNVDSVGLPGPTYVWASRADPRLVKMAGQMAASLKLDFAGMNIDHVGDSDSHPFLDKKIPVIDFHSLASMDQLKMLHSPRDLPSALDQASYYNSYRLICAFLAYLDGASGPVPQQ